MPLFSARRPGLWTVGVLMAAVLVAIGATTLGTLRTLTPGGTGPQLPAPTVSLSPQPGAIAGVWAPERGSTASTRVGIVRDGRPDVLGGSSRIDAGSLRIAGTRLVAGELPLTLPPMRLLSSPGSAGRTATQDTPTSAAPDDSAAASAEPGSGGETWQPVPATLTLGIAEETDLPDLEQTGEALVTLPGLLRSGNREQYVAVTARMVRDAHGIALDGSVDISWADFGIAPPQQEGVKVQPKGRIDLSLRLHRTD